MIVVGHQSINNVIIHDVVVVFCPLHVVLRKSSKERKCMTALLAMLAVVVDFDGDR